MAESTDPSIEERIQRLEQIVADLQASRSRQAEPEAPRPAAVDPRRHASAVSVTPAPRSVPRRPSRWQLPAALPDDWLNKLGIAMLLLGVAFLFKYSVDQGWTTPPVRLAFGLTVGTALLFIGSRVHVPRRRFSQVLLGGGVAVYYLCGFAAFQLFGLISQPLAMIFMVLVTFLAFVLALRQDEAVLAVIGTLGGLSTPFLLHTESGSIPGLVIYTCVLVTAMMAVYFYRGWRTLMWACTLGGWAVLMAATHAAEDTGQGMAAVQAGLAFGWLAFGLLPVLREVARDGNRERWLCPPFGIAERMLAPPGIRVLAQHVHLACVSSPLLALMLSMALWDGRITDRSFGWLTLATAAVYGGWAWGLGRLAALESLARTQRLVAILLSTIGLCLILDGEARFLALATEAGVLHVLRRRLPGRLTLFATHALSVVVALLAIVRLLEHGPDLEPGFTASSFATLWAFVVAAGVALLSSGTVRVVYALGAHVGFLAWLARELQPMADGAAYLTIAWAVHGLLLLAVGAWRHADQLRTLGLLTLLLAVAKLILFDLAQLEAIWRVLLFMGFGALFLVISYYARSLWRPDDEPPTSTTELP